eukprot:gene21401-28359_t
MRPSSHRTSHHLSLSTINCTATGISSRGKGFQGTSARSSVKSVRPNGRVHTRLVVVAALGVGNKERRVVVTGMGVVSCLGCDVDAFYNGLLEGKSGITTIEGFDTADYTTKFAGEIKSVDAKGYIQPKFEKRVDKLIRDILVSVKAAG